MTALANALAHGVRNPLAGARARVESIAGGKVAGAASRAASDEALQCLDRVRDVVDAIVELACPSEPVVHAFDLGNWLRRHTPLLVRECAIEGASLTVRVPSTPCHASGDPVQLLKAVRYLLRDLFETKPESLSIECIEQSAGIWTLHIIPRHGHSTAAPDSPGPRLALSVAGGIASAFGAKLQFVRRADGDVTTRIVLPAGKLSEIPEAAPCS